MKPDEMREIMYAFKAKYPNHEGLNITQMKKVLDGVLVIVNDAVKKNGFYLMKKADTLPGGKLDQHNAAVREHNRQVRAEKKARQAMARERFNLLMQGRYEEAFANLPNVIVNDYDEVINKAEQFLGDVMYEWFSGDMQAIENISDEDLRSCRFEAILGAVSHREDIEAIVDHWEKRGF